MKAKGNSVVHGMPRPMCAYCDFSNPAMYVAAQSADLGKSIGWVFICHAHSDGWNDGSDWVAPVYRIGITVQRKLRKTPRREVSYAT